MAVRGCECHIYLCCHLEQKPNVHLCNMIPNDCGLFPNKSNYPNKWRYAIHITQIQFIRRKRKRVLLKTASMKWVCVTHNDCCKRHKVCIYMCVCVFTYQRFLSLTGKTYKHYNRRRFQYSGAKHFPIRSRDLPLF